jgi:signal transduction histidine kinase
MWKKHAIIQVFIWSSIFLTGAAVYHSHELEEYGSARKNMQTEIDVLSALIKHQLQQSDYESAENIIQYWVKNSTDISEIKLITKNGFELSHFEKKQRPDHIETLVSSISYSYNGIAKLVLSKSFDGIDKHIIWFRYQILAIYFISILIILFLFKNSIKLQNQKIEIEFKNELLKKSHEELIKNKNELALSSQYKSDFMANMSHELRTPLNSIFALSSLLKENKKGSMSESEQTSLDMIKTSGENLLALINDLLDFSTMQSGSMDILQQEITTKDLVTYIEQSFRSLTESKGLIFNIEAEDDIPSTLVADKIRVEQLLRSLMINAIKFTNDGHINVRFFISEKQKNCLAISIEDTGIGISKNEQKNIFKAFRQIDSGLTRKFGGTGIGLAIAAELKKLLGAEITLSSELDRGSIFTLHLPLT